MPQGSWLLLLHHPCGFPPTSSTLMSGPLLNPLQISQFVPLFPPGMLMIDSQVLWAARHRVEGLGRHSSGEKTEHRGRR